MRTPLHTCVAAVAIAVLAASVAAGQRAPAVGSLTTEEKRAGWTLLFDGASLDGWRGYRQSDATRTRWRVADGLLAVAPGEGAERPTPRDLISVSTFDRFDLAFEWRIAPGGNSGLKYFVLEDGNSAIGHEYQLIDDEAHADATLGLERQTASLYDVLAPSNRRVGPPGRFNQSRILVTG